MTYAAAAAMQRHKKAWKAKTAAEWIEKKIEKGNEEKTGKKTCGLIHSNSYNRKKGEKLVYKKQ